MKLHSIRSIATRKSGGLLLADVTLLPLLVVSAQEGGATTSGGREAGPTAVLETHEQVHSGGLFGGELREYLGSQLGVIGWSDDGSEFVVRGVGLTPDQVSRISADAQRLGVPVRVVAAALATSEQHQLIDLIREQVLHALPAEVGWSIGIDLDTQRIGVTVEGHADLPELDLAIRGVASAFVTALELERAVSNAPALGEIEARHLYYVADGEFAHVDWRDTLHARGGEWLGGLDGVCTSGFLFKSGSLYRLSTAGHCADGGDWVGDVGAAVAFVDEDGNLTGTRIGTITHNLYEDGGTDIALMSLPSASWTVGRVTTSANTYRDVTGVKEESDLNHNDQQCFVGYGIHHNWNYDKKCGPQKKENITHHPSGSPSGFEIEGMYCLERRTIGGDSGGPVYYESGSDAIAAGTMVFSKKETPLFSTTKWYACYQTVTDIESATGFSVVVS